MNAIVSEQLIFQMLTLLQNIYVITGNVCVCVCVCVYVSLWN